MNVPRYHLALASALDAPARLAPSSVSLVLTSPPYYGLRSYEGVEPSDWPAVEYVPMAGLPPVSVPAWRGCLGLEPDPLMYVGHLVAIFRAWRGALHPTGGVWVNLGDTYASTSTYNAPRTSGGEFGRVEAPRQPNAGIPSGLKPKDLIAVPWRFALAMQADGWFLRSAPPWIKKNGLPESMTDRLTVGHEWWFHFAASESYFYDADAVRVDASYGNHPRTVLDNGPRAVPPGTSPHKGIRSAPSKDAGRNRRTSDVWRESVEALADDCERHAAHLRAALDASGAVMDPDDAISAFYTTLRGSTDEHYAAYAPHLIAPIIRAGASERGVCPKCYAPWERVTEKHDRGFVDRRTFRSANNGNGDGMHRNGTGATTLGHGIVRRTIDWRPTCDCMFRDLPRRDVTDVELSLLAEAALRDFGPIPALVADPFNGSGTTGVVALGEGRRYFGCDLSQKYLDMSEPRLRWAVDHPERYDAPERAKKTTALQGSLL